MNAHHSVDGDEIEIADSWGRSVIDDLERSRRIAWIVAGVAGAIALLLTIALVILLPLKTTEPYTLLVDRQTGYVEELAPLERSVVSPDAALTRSFLVQYVIARESYDYDNLPEAYRKVALWSEGEARERYLSLMNSANPANPFADLPRNAIVKTQITSVSSLSADRSLVRFQTTRSDPGGQPQEAQNWAAIVSYRFSGAEMTAEDRLLNPLGFQVTRYRKDAESLPIVQEVIPAPATLAPADSAQ